MKKFLFTAMGLVAFAAPALAADMAPAPYTKAPAMVVDPGYNWSGFYIGGNVGAIGSTGRSVHQCITGAGVPNGPIPTPI